MAPPFEVESHFEVQPPFEVTPPLKVVSLWVVAEVVQRGRQLEVSVRF